MSLESLPDDDLSSDEWPSFEDDRQPRNTNMTFKIIGRPELLTGRGGRHFSHQFTTVNDNGPGLGRTGPGQGPGAGRGASQDVRSLQRAGPEGGQRSQRDVPAQGRGDVVPASEAASQSAKRWVRKAGFQTKNKKRADSDDALAVFKFGCKVGKLLPIYGDEAHETHVHKFLHRFLPVCQEKGIEIFEVLPPKLVNLEKEVAREEQVLKEFAVDTASDTDVPILLYFDSTWDPQSHRYLKILEPLLQVRTQHITVETIVHTLTKQPNDIYKIAMKLNLKIAGPRDYTIPSQFSAVNWPESTMILGYSIAHPKIDGIREPGEGPTPELLNNGVSVVGFSANVRKCPAKFIGDFHYQNAFEDLVEGSILKARIKWMLGKYLKNRQQLPKHILIAREGVVEELYGRIVNEEVNDIKEACELFVAGYRPKIVFVASVPQEEHVPWSRASYNLLYSDIKEPISSIAVEIYMLGLCYEKLFYDTGAMVPEPIYLANVWAQHGGNVFWYYRQCGFKLPLAGGSPDTERLTAMLSTKDTPLEGINLTF